MEIETALYWCHNYGSVEILNVEMDAVNVYFSLEARKAVCGGKGKGKLGHIPKVR